MKYIIIFAILFVSSCAQPEDSKMKDNSESLLYKACGGWDNYSIHLMRQKSTHSITVLIEHNEKQLKFIFSEDHKLYKKTANILMKAPVVLAEIKAKPRKNVGGKDLPIAEITYYSGSRKIQKNIDFRFNKSYGRKYASFEHELLSLLELLE